MIFALVSSPSSVFVHTQIHETELRKIRFNSFSLPLWRRIFPFIGIRVPTCYFSGGFLFWALMGLQVSNPNIIIWAQLLYNKLLMILFNLKLQDLLDLDFSFIKNCI